eukprot:157583-Chlamydomonas_euryale.AAC.1
MASRLGLPIPLCVSFEMMHCHTGASGVMDGCERQWAGGCIQAKGGCIQAKGECIQAKGVHPGKGWVHTGKAANPPSASTLLAGSIWARLGPWQIRSGWFAGQRASEWA